MKLTSAAAVKMIRLFNADINKLKTVEQERSSFTASTDEKLEDVRPEYDFPEIQSQLEALEKKVRVLKHAVNLFNTGTVLPEFGMTIDEALVYMPQLNARVQKYDAMRTAQPKERARAYMVGNGRLTEYKYANYRITDAAEAYEKSSLELTRLQTALDLANNTLEFEVEGL